VDLGEARDFVRDNHRAVLSTMRRDGTPQSSPVTCGVADDGAIVISTREAAAKTANVRRHPRIWLCVLSDGFFGPFVQVEGTAAVVSLPEAMDGLIDYYRMLSGEHPDWDDYRAAMIRDQRVLIRMTPTRAGPDYSG
jgi:PPOX class probable F420-dependent enzyme